MTRFFTERREVFEICTVCGNRVFITINSGSGFCCENCRKKSKGNV